MPGPRKTVVMRPCVKCRRNHGQVRQEFAGSRRRPSATSRSLSTCRNRRPVRRSHRCAPMPPTASHAPQTRVSKSAALLRYAVTKHKEPTHQSIFGLDNRASCLNPRQASDPNGWTAPTMTIASRTPSGTLATRARCRESRTTCSIVQESRPLPSRALRTARCVRGAMVASTRRSYIPCDAVPIHRGTLVFHWCCPDGYNGSQQDFDLHIYF